MFRAFISLSIVVVAGQFLVAQNFVDINEDIQIPNYHTGTFFGGGLCAEDYDQDGDVDIYVLTGNGFENILFRNDGLGNFETVESNLSLEMQSRSAVWFDFNNDGLLDIFIAGDNFPSTYDPVAYWKLFKQTEAGDFEDVTMQSGIGLIESEDAGSNVGGLCAGDLNMDGFLDLIITYYVGNPFQYEDRLGFNAVLLNLQDGTFELRNDLLPYREPVTLWQPAIFDFDRDGFNEVYVAQDHQGSNYYFDSDGFQFTERAADFGLGHGQWDMGVTICDFNNDTNYDLHITNIKYDYAEPTGNSLLQNNGNFQFTNIASNGLNEGGWSWGASAQDFDNDGDFDLAVTNGYTGFKNDQSKYWRNDGNMNFVDASVGVRFSDQNVGTALVSFDFDGDNDIDMIQTLNSYIGGHEMPIRFLRNELPPDDQTNYIRVIPRMLTNNKWAIGASVSIEFDGNVVSRPITANTGFYSQEPANAFFGLKDATIVDKITVTWPGGAQTILDDVSANQSITITDEGALHPPHSIIATAVDGAISLSWSCESETTGFYIQRAENPNFSNPVPLANVSELSYLDTDVEQFSDYYYRISSIRNENVSNPSFGVEVISEDAQVAAPSNLVVVRETPSIAKLTWSDNADNELNYRVFRSLDVGFSQYFEIELPENSIEYTDNSIEPGFDYYYKVRAERAGSVSDFSEIGRASYVLGVNQSEDFVVYPSPSSGVIHIRFENDVQCIFQLVNAAGQCIEKWTSEGSHQKNLGVKEGIYFLQVMTNGVTTSRKIVVE